MDFGAVGDGDTDDTAAFRSAWKAACQVENGVVLVPSDLVFVITSTIFSGPSQPGLVFQVDGSLMPPDGPDCWPESDSNKQWLVFYNLDNMSFTGIGTIEGNGQKWWNLPCKPHRHNFPRTLEALIMHAPSPVGAEVLTRKFDQMDQIIAEDDRSQFYEKFYSVFDNQFSAMDTLLNGKESFACQLQAFDNVLVQYLGTNLDRTKPSRE